MKEEKVLLFMEDFNEIMTFRNEEKSVSSFDEETKDIILHYIGHFEEEDLLMVGSANTLYNIDREILAPGRFDVVIPIFPPNARERSQMILYHMTESLSDDATLMKILVKNNADHLPFWEHVSSKMKTFSNTMIIDFTQSLKKRIRSSYQKNNNENIKIDQSLLDASLRDASSKLTEEYLNQVAQFIHDVSVNNADNFNSRIEALQYELDNYKVIEAPRKSIGFTHNDDGK